LRSFAIVIAPISPEPKARLFRRNCGMTEQELVDHHTLFRDSEHLAHIRTMFQKLLAS